MPTGTRCSSARSPGCGGGGDEPVVSMVMCLLPRYGRVLSVYWDDVKKTVGVLEGRISESDLWPRLAKGYCCPRLHPPLLHRTLYEYSINLYLISCRNAE